MTSADRHSSPPVTKAELRKFGLSIGIAFMLIFGVFLPLLFSFSVPRWPFLLGGALVVAAIVVPGALRFVRGAWMWAALRIGAFNSRLLLAIVFYLVFTPVGFMRRRFSGDVMGEPDESLDTYRKPSRRRVSSSFERPF